jgi:integrase
VGTWTRGAVLNDAWDRARTAAGILGAPAAPAPGRRKAPTPHDARATGASLLFAVGASVPEVQQWLGRSNAVLTLNVYTEVQRCGQADPILTQVLESRAATAGSPR